MPKKGAPLGGAHAGDDGDGGGARVAANLRAAFVAPAGKVLVAADYSQIEASGARASPRAPRAPPRARRSFRARARPFAFSSIPARRDAARVTRARALQVRVLAHVARDAALAALFARGGDVYEDIAYLLYTSPSPRDS